MGCVASPGQDPPPLTSVYCPALTLLTPAAVRDCVYVQVEGEQGGDGEGRGRLEGLGFWRIENSTNSFFVQSQGETPRFQAYDLRAPLLHHPEP